MACCNLILKLPDVPSCSGSTINFGIQAKNDGEHELHLDYLGTEFVFKKGFVVDEQIIFPTDMLNEDYVFEGQLFEPDGTKILISKNGVLYDCFSFKTTIRNTIEIPGPAPEE
jgi:hypothetical protein